MSVSPQPASGSSATATGKIRRVAILFAGGPAPAANAVISTAAASFLRNGIEVVGILNGYSHLVEFSPDHPMQEGRDYIMLDQQAAPPDAEHPGHHDRHRPDQPRQGRLAARATSPTPSGPPRCGPSTQALASLGVDALISIGGDDTLKTANKFKLFQDHLPAGRAADRRRPRPQDDRQRLPRHRLHVRLLHGRRDARRRDPQPAGRRRGDPRLLPRRDAWAAAPAGWPTGPPSPARPASSSASRTSTASCSAEETLTDPKTGDDHDAQDHEHREGRRRIVKTMLAREHEGKEFGVIVLAEGLAEYPARRATSKGSRATTTATSRSAADQPGPDCSSRLVEEEYEKRTGKKPQGHRAAARLRGPLRPAPRLRRHARQPARRRRLPRPGREGAQRRDGLVLRPAQPPLRAVREAGRPGDPGHRRPLHRARLRLPPARPVPRELSRTNPDDRAPTSSPGGPSVRERRIRAVGPAIYFAPWRPLRVIRVKRPNSLRHHPPGQLREARGLALHQAARCGRSCPPPRR